MFGIWDLTARKMHNILLISHMTETEGDYSYTLLLLAFSLRDSIIVI